MGENGDLFTPPTEIIGHRLVLRNGRKIPQLLISWLGASIDEATWEDEEIFLADNPHLALRVEDWKKRNEALGVWAAEGNEVSAAKDTTPLFIPQTRSQHTGNEPFQDSHGSDFSPGLGDKAHLPGVGIDMSTGPMRPNRLKSAPAWRVRSYSKRSRCNSLHQNLAIKASFEQQIKAEYGFHSYKWTHEEEKKEEHEYMHCNEGLSGESLRTALPRFQKLFKNFKTLSHFFVFKDESEPEEMRLEVGYPTDVKHMTHIGLDGCATSFFWNNNTNLHSLPLKQFEIAYRERR
ncbi:CRIB domain-containing protein ric4-like [Orobanche gracilis]